MQVVLLNRYLRFLWSSLPVALVRDDVAKTPLRCGYFAVHVWLSVRYLRELTVKRQCELLNVNRISVYYEPKNRDEAARDHKEHVKARIDYWHTKMSYLGVRRLSEKLWKEDGIKARRKLVRRYMDEMGIYCVYPKPNLSKNGKEHRRFPYLLRNKTIFMPNQVWAIDIIYIKMGRTHIYDTIFFYEFVNCSGGAISPLRRR